MGVSTSETKPGKRVGGDDFDASLEEIMERLRRQAEEIAKLREDLDKVRSDTVITVPPASK